ncbi:hypothetical protein [Donghicola mangrovi]|uniref:Uncharacterized protein n=1 Tax=Donghicola mangrovi TaxID=2729614 RepID=A0A850Q107_9RHOB|nr:hypothetical protein [Donghicola mangrovi]NVO22674.1 hypothetical protein [Donghicola mangrovi]
MRHFLRHICLSALFAAILPAGQVWAGNGIYLLQIGAETGLGEEHLFDQPLLANLDVTGQDPLVEVIQMGAALSADVHVHGTDCHVELHQLGVGQFASVSQSGWHNDVVLSQGF